MPSSAERQVVHVLPPTQSNTAGTGVTILAASTSAANTAVPEAYAYTYVFLQADGDKVWVAFGASASPDLDKSEAGGESFDEGTSNTNGIPIPNGTRIHVRLHPTDHAYLKWQADSTTAKLLVYPATPNGKGG